MPSYPEDIAMRFLSWKQLKDLVPYTRQHIGRLETRVVFQSACDLETVLAAGSPGLRRRYLTGAAGASTEGTSL